MAFAGEAAGDEQGGAVGEGVEAEGGYRGFAQKEESAEPGGKKVFQPLELSQPLGLYLRRGLTGAAAFTGWRRGRRWQEGKGSEDGFL